MGLVPSSALPTQRGIDMVLIMSNVTTEDARKRLEALSRDHSYRVEEWLSPREAGGLKVVAAMKIDGTRHSRGFAWDGNSINDLAVLCMALDVSMQGLPEYVRSMKTIRKGMN